MFLKLIKLLPFLLGFLVADATNSYIEIPDNHETTWFERVLKKTIKKNKERIQVTLKKTKKKVLKSIVDRMQKFSNEFHSMIKLEQNKKAAN